jgi:hypothetical protein
MVPGNQMLPCQPQQHQTPSCDSCGKPVMGIERFTVARVRKKGREEDGGKQSLYKAGNWLRVCMYVCMCVGCAWQFNQSRQVLQPANTVMRRIWLVRNRERKGTAAKHTALR